MDIKERIEYTIGNYDVLEKMQTIPAWKPFDERAFSFLDELSKAIIKSKGSKEYPDLLTLAFWLRRSNLKGMIKKYTEFLDYLGRGVVFHIAPGNMALSFAYSLATGLLTGNANIIRLASRRFAQADYFCDLLRESIEENEEIKERVCLIKYPHDKDLTDHISMMCDLRIIWGGDNAVNEIRKSALKPRATEITFSNRFSICVINADEYLSAYDPKKTAHDFYLDTYLTDQNACSSPRIIFWMGKKRDEAKKTFFDALKNKIDNYEMAAVTTSEKLLTYCRFAATNKCIFKTEGDYRIVRIFVDNVNEDVLDNIGNSGFFYECDIDDVDEILPICNTTLQTISYIGIDPKIIRDAVIENGVCGVDRIVPVGKTMDFDFNWDGKDIIREMTRKVVNF